MDDKQIKCSHLQRTGIKIKEIENFIEIGAYDILSGNLIVTKKTSYFDYDYIQALEDSGYNSYEIINQKIL